MGKAIKNLRLGFIILCSFFFSIISVSANSINKVDMDVYLDSNGNAKITEVWDVYFSQGTEGYKSYVNLKNSSISNFSVSDDSNRIYESLPSWNVNASFESKAYKSGINNISNGVELCWGISNYGNRKYELKYDMSNFVTQYTDVQGIYFNFLNLKQYVGDAKITIHSDIPFSLENSRIWAFGNNGNIDFENGSIVLNSDGSLSASQYMTILVRFESNLYNTENKSNVSFDKIYDSAFSDVTDPSYSKNNNGAKKHHITLAEIVLALTGSVLLLILNPGTWIIAFWLMGKIKGKEWLWGSHRYSGELNFGQYGRMLPSDSQINYWRDIPCDKDLERAYWVCDTYNVIPEKTLEQGIIGAILLKWIKNGYVTVLQTKRKLFSFKDNNYAIDFRGMTHADNEIEESLFDMLVSAAGFNKILEAKEFSKWSKKNYHKVNSWFSSITIKEQKRLEQQGLITNTTEETAGMFGKTKIITIKNVNQQLRQDAIQIKGLKKFLLDFSNMPEKEYFEVHIWEEYLIFAQLLGIADKVEEQFSKLYPNFSQETLLNTNIATITARSMAEICYNGVQAGVKRAERRSRFSSSYSGSDRSSGGGGSSYDSGGSSAGGSSGGGAR